MSRLRLLAIAASAAALAACNPDPAPPQYGADG